MSGRTQNTKMEVHELGGARNIRLRLHHRIVHVVFINMDW